MLGSLLELAARGFLQGTLGPGKHDQHPVGDDQTEHQNRRRLSAASHQNCTDQDHTVNGIGARHKWCVQGRGDLGYHLNSDEDRQYEDRQPDYWVSVHLLVPFAPLVQCSFGSPSPSTCPAWVIHIAAVISSSKSGAKRPS